ncbi:hypothetical protein H257_17211 [Aphanomyces astaci]|uniref:Uncharacterized protein n=1 Tax=Aphanomyces astaci TaxID=112090 RepID=W4FFL3_APHAT|nr:hypothetical protein H257_17211 [Aphanomyces astaci]ETV66307.1 hypothetical protein H257_17211 [Aphanomyces astaci]|eukprot:XP_009844213.1 hypothetical protein H257_17211 [Aphanomyces astaci]
MIDCEVVDSESGDGQLERPPCEQPVARPPPDGARERPHLAVGFVDLAESKHAGRIETTTRNTTTPADTATADDAAKITTTPATVKTTTLDTRKTWFVVSGVVVFITAGTTNDGIPPPAALNAKYDQEQQTYNRLKNILKLPCQGYVDMTDVACYSYGLVRSVDQFIEFSGISPNNAELDTHRCNQLHWVPYAHPEVVEAWVPGYHMHPLVPDISPSQAAMNNKQVHALMDLLVNATSTAGKQAIADGLRQQKANVDELLKQVAALTILSDEWKEVKNAVVQDKEQ